MICNLFYSIGDEVKYGIMMDSNEEVEYGFMLNKISDIVNGRRKIKNILKLDMRRNKYNFEGGKIFIYILFYLVEGVEV